MNILYLYRKDRWDSLKFSLRSLQYVNHSQVWVVGDKVSYNVKNIVTEQKQNRYDDTNNSLRVGTRFIPQGEEVLLMHDDMFLLPGYTPIKYYRGYLKDHNIGGEREAMLNNALKRLGNEAKFYDIHYPVPFVNRGFEYDERLAFMSMLGNQPEFESKHSEDCKFKVPTIKQLSGLTCFSTYNETDDLKPIMLNLYPEKSIFE